VNGWVLRRDNFKLWVPLESCVTQTTFIVQMQLFVNSESLKPQWRGPLQPISQGWRGRRQPKSSIEHDSESEMEIWNKIESFLDSDRVAYRRHTHIATIKTMIQ
jgi:hypothetical protein